MRRLIVALALLAFPALARAQSIDPGMTREQVVAALGKPIGERTTGIHTYLFYQNGCEHRCGMNDVVILENDAVVDAIFRGDRHHYTGASSSPVAVAPARSGSARPAAMPGDSTQAAAAPRRKVARKRAAPAGQLPPGAPRSAGIVIGTAAPGAARPPVNRVNAIVPTPAARADSLNASTNAVPLATPPTVTKPTVTPPTGAVPAQGAAPAPTNAPASNAGPAPRNPRAPAATPPGAPTRPDSGKRPTPPGGTTPPQPDSTRKP